MDKPYLVVDEVASLLGKSSKWVYQHKAEIPGYFKLAGSIFFDQEHLVQSLRELAAKPAKREAHALKDKHRLLS